MLADGDEEIVSPSLLDPQWVDSNVPLNPDFDLGMSDWLSDSTGPAPPPPKRLGGGGEIPFHIFGRTYTRLQILGHMRTTL